MVKSFSINTYCFNTDNQQQNRLGRAKKAATFDNKNKLKLCDFILKSFPRQFQCTRYYLVLKSQILPSFTIIESRAVLV